MFVSQHVLPSSMSNNWSRPFCLRVIVQVPAKPLQSPIIVVADVRELLISSSRNFLEIQTLEKEHLDRLPLRLWKRLKCFACKPATLLRLKAAWRPEACRFINGAYVSLVVQVPHQ